MQDISMSSGGLAGRTTRLLAKTADLASARMQVEWSSPARWTSRWSAPASAKCGQIAFGLDDIR